MTYAGVAAAMIVNPDQPVEVPWPPTDKDAKKKSVKPAEIAAFLKEKLSSDDYDHLQELLKTQSAPFMAQMEEQLRLQKTAMEEQKSALNLKK